jgi:hypothetical protein
VDMVRLRLSLQNRKGTRLSAEQEAQFFACFLHQASIFLSLSVGTGYISQSQTSGIDLARRVGIQSSGFARVGFLRPLLTLFRIRVMAMIVFQFRVVAGTP